MPPDHHPPPTPPHNPPNHPWQPAEPRLPERLDSKLRSSFQARLFDWANPEKAREAWAGRVVAGVVAGRGLVLEEEVQIRDTWGLDCYTFRNVVDTLLETGEFGGTPLGAVG